mmetsp:Transcript_103575/g.297631  ORF Transcript_103575/g.297631 Transcript_103575/m.297631 type:complete len:247 (-) Transcript_103575:627-1367(-)
MLLSDPLRRMLRCLRPLGHVVKLERVACQRVYPRRGLAIRQAGGHSVRCAADSVSCGSIQCHQCVQAAGLLVHPVSIGRTVRAVYTTIALALVPSCASVHRSMHPRVTVVAPGGMFRHGSRVKRRRAALNEICQLSDAQRAVVIIVQGVYQQSNILIRQVSRRDLEASAYQPLEFCVVERAPAIFVPPTEEDLRRSAVARSLELRLNLLRHSLVYPFALALVLRLKHGALVFALPQQRVAFLQVRL